MNPDSDIFIDNFVYENGVPVWVNSGEGRIVYNTSNNTWFAENYIKDHLGNVRVAYYLNNNVVTTRQVDSYYPFGMNIKGLTANIVSSASIRPNEYQYNGKMFQDEGGLNWLDYGWRFYDPAIARWHVPDPKSEKYFDFSPYNYALNNPLYFVDPMGDTIKFAGANEAQSYGEYKSEVDSRVTAYDKRTQQLRNKGKTAKADKRDANRSNNAYVQIQGELGSLESSETVFRVRMGENVTSSNGSGNLWYNSGTNEVDVNLSNYGDFTTTQKMAHELTHGYQFLNQEIDFQNNGMPGLLYDKTDEIAAFNRQNLFLQAGQSAVDSYSTVNSSPDYRSLPSGPVSFHLYPQVQQVQYKLYNKAAFHKGKPPALIYPGWKSDYK